MSLDRGRQLMDRGFPAVSSSPAMGTCYVICRDRAHREPAAWTGIFLVNMYFENGGDRQ